MNILLYESKPTKAGEGLLNLLRRQCAGSRVIVCRDPQALVSNVRSSSMSGTLLLILAAGREDLVEIQQHRPLIGDRPIIVLLADLRDETLAAAHRMRPRFLFDVDGNVEHVAVVIAKMMNRVPAWS